MKITQYCPITKQFEEYEVAGPNHSQRIVGRGYFVIINPSSEYASFSKQSHDICFGDIVPDIIPSYTNKQYAADFGDRTTGIGCTVREYMQRQCNMTV